MVPEPVLINVGVPATGVFGGANTLLDRCAGEGDLGTCEAMCGGRAGLGGWFVYGEPTRLCDSAVAGWIGVCVLCVGGAGAGVNCDGVYWPAWCCCCHRGGGGATPACWTGVGGFADVAAAIGLF